MTENVLERNFNLPNLHAQRDTRDNGNFGQPGQY